MLERFTLANELYHSPDEPLGPTVKIWCHECEWLVEASVQGSVATTNDAEPGGPPVDRSLVFLVRCDSCEKPMLGGLEGDRYGYGGVPSQLWPSPPHRMPTDAPSILHRGFDEAQQCVLVGAYRAAAFLARTVLEGIVREADPDGPAKERLAARIERLENQGIFDSRVVKWANSLKTIGNDAAHDLKTEISREDAIDVLLLVEAIAVNVYVYEPLHQRLVERSQPVEGDGWGEHAHAEAAARRTTANRADWLGTPVEGGRSSNGALSDGGSSMRR